MYKVLVVDDEAIIRDGIKQIIPWQKLGVEQILLAGSGEQAMRLLEKESVDLMITDIRMVNMDGLELIAKVNEVKPDMRIIVLTGYDSFEYSQQCCRMEVHDFLLKPINENELEASIRKQLEILRQKEKKKQQNRILSRATGISEQVRFENEMKRILTTPTLSDEMRSLLMEHSYNPTELLQIIVMLPMISHAKTLREQDALIYLTAKSMCIGMFDATNQGVTFEDEAGRIVVAVFVEQRFDEVEERARALRSLLKAELGASFTILLGSRVSGLEELHLSYNDAMSMLGYAETAGSKILQTEKSELRLRLFRDTVNELTAMMEESIGDEYQFLKAFDTYLQCISSYSLSVSMMRRTTYTIVSRLYYGHMIETGQSADNSLTGFINSIRNSSVTEVGELARDFLSHLFFQERQQYHDVIVQAKKYINDHLSDDLSVSAIAKQHYVTINHLSRLFKKETGEGCNEYIVRKRMEKAKNILETTTIKSGRIAAMVGYKDINYFSLAFKRHSGLSPTEYREKMRQSG